MNKRKITSMTMFISFILVGITSIILFIVPHGRVAYWADWHMFGLSKGEWGNLHINLGFLMFFAGLMHMYYNWAPIKAYMKNRARELKVFTPSFNIALLLTMVVSVGTYLEAPPFISVINMGEAIKDNASKHYGEPPYGHAELSTLKHFLKKQNLDEDIALEILNKANIKFTDSNDTLLTIADANNISPAAIAILLKPAGQETMTGEKAVFPDKPMSGFGNKTVAGLCSEYNLHFRTIREKLAEKGVHVEAEMTVKEIAEENKKGPMEIFDILHEIINEKK